ncbi:unnamed protein product [Rotaria socialis]|uniref:Uncharacterized protein n=1 Tax=Rotaria socialis TaxID=392032 RepID=A0A818W286_9BILA|nr:unnamed protein product [Rotaria socialis]
MYVYRLFSNGKAEFIDKQQDLLDSIQIIHEKSKTIFVPTPISYDFPSEVNIQKLEWRNIERCAACIDPKEINKDLLYNQFND